MKIAIIQMDVSLDKQKNINVMRDFVEKSGEKGADIAVLPEMFNCPYSNAYFLDYAEEAGGHSYTALSQAASSNNIYVVGGSIPELDKKSIYNTSFVFDRTGAEIARHRKVQLFSIDIPGRLKFSENDTFKAGDKITVFETEFGKMGLIICFDIRFPEICRLTALKGAKIIFAPSAFGMITGSKHWELLFRLRAVENQLFTVGASPSRDGNNAYKAYGNSIAVDPWGNILYRANIQEEMGVVDLDLNEIEEVRKQLPMISIMRDDVYTIEEK